MKKLLSLIFALAIVFGLSSCKNEFTGYGSYECEACGHVYEPSYATVLFSLHLGSIRKMTCPKCGETTWQKYVITEE